MAHKPDRLLLFSPVRARLQSRALLFTPIFSHRGISARVLVLYDRKLDAVVEPQKNRAWEEIVMNLRMRRGSRLAIALLTLPLLSFGAAAQLAVSSNDGKAVRVNGAYAVPAKPADDTVTIIDLGASPPKLLG